MILQFFWYQKTSNINTTNPINNYEDISRWRTILKIFFFVLEIGLITWNCVIQINFHLIVIVSVLVAVTLGALAQGQRIGERRRVRLRGRTRASASRAINSPLPVIQQVQPVSALSCPQPEGLQVYPDPTSCNRFYKVRLDNI